MTLNELAVLIRKAETGVTSASVTFWASYGVYGFVTWNRDVNEGENRRVFHDEQELIEILEGLATR